MMKMKMVEIDDYLTSLDNGSEYGFSVHDANEFFTPIGDARTVEEVTRITVDFDSAPFKPKLRVKMEVDAGSGSNWAEASYPDLVDERAAP
jgi:DNA polymerase I-like protein with 3'-5' exonuclease and polymerase domains